MDKRASIKRKRIVLAALLHDIGKFWQRADKKYNESEFIKKHYRGNFNMTVPTYENGYPKYVHALWTNVFFEETRIGAKLGLNLGNDESLGNLSANHHKPSTHDEAIITLADRWSSGIDRPDEGEEGVSGYGNVKQKYGNDFVRKVPMHSIFDTIRKGDYSNIEVNHTYPLKPLKVFDNNNIFSNAEGQLNSNEYQTLWEDFYTELNELLNNQSITDFDSFYISLLTLLKKYTWSIPSATNVLPSNVSLFEHLKSTAAIALSTYDYFESKESQLSIVDHTIVNQLNEDVLLMVCIDISGIQKFIYDIHSKKAAPSLKGRSFFLELLIKSTLYEVLTHREINAYESNVIYASGGKAYLILPNTGKVKTALEELQVQIADKLFEYSGTKLFVSIGYTSFRYESIRGEINGRKGFLNRLITDDADVVERYGDDNEEFNLSKLWRSVSDKAADRKNQKFKNTLANKFEDLFKNGEDYQEGQKLCDVTGVKITGQGHTIDNLTLSNQAADQINIGRDLRTAEYVNYHDKGLYIAADIGERFSLTNENGVALKSIVLNEWPDYTTIKCGASHMFYGGNYQPSIENRSKTFEELCSYRNDNSDNQTTKLGVLRMDIDNLGQIFINGLITQSFASYATLSMLLETFFAGYINHIQRRSEIIKEHVQILYSGGDDVFAVGRWDAIIEFAVEIRKEFERYVQRKDITISAGIAINHPKYPIYKAADEAGHAEEAAKNFTSESYGDKNAITLFGQTISWNTEWDEVVRLKNQFVKYQDNLPRSFLHALQHYLMLKNDNTKKQKDYSYIWHSGYRLTRMEERLKKSEIKELVRNIKMRIIRDEKLGDRFLDIAGLAARWAEYIIKQNNK